MHPVVSGTPLSNAELAQTLNLFGLDIQCDRYGGFETMGVRIVWVPLLFTDSGSMRPAAGCTAEQRRVFPYACQGWVIGGRVTGGDHILWGRRGGMG